MSESAKKTLLLVEDEAILALNEKLELEKYGYIVKTVSNGEKAIDAVKTMPEIALVLMDINLGNGIDGTQAAEIILKDHDIPIVFVSSHSEREIVEKTEKITSYGYVVKNSSITVLDASIKMAFKLFDAKIRELRKENELRESEKRIQKKLQALTTFETNISDLELADIIDVDTVQSLMDDFYEVTRFPVAIIDLAGKVIVQTGWQDICTKFHRMHPETLKNCIECDTILTKNIPAGEFKSYLCKNNLWDNVTPLIIGNNHVGNLFTGQFFYEGEKPDDSVFISQAEKYGFDKEDYMDAMHRVPIWKREVAAIGLRFYAKLAHTISALSHVNMSLHKTIGEHKEVEESLRESEMRLKAVVENNPSLTTITNAEGQVEFVSPQCEKVIGWPIEDIIGSTLPDFIHPDDRNRVFAEHAKVMRSQSINDFEYRIYDKQNKVRWISHSTSFIKIGINNLVVSSISNITERKKVEEALRESEAKFRAMVETFPLAIHQSVGVEQITDYMNPTMVKLFGYTQADIPSVAQWWPLAYPDKTYRRQIAEEWTKKVKHAIATQSPIEPMEVVCTCKDGSKKNISWGYITLGDKNYSYGLDITERKKSEEEVQKQLTEKELILKEVHHRIKNNMNTVGSLLSLQANTTTEPAIIMALMDARNRIQSMSVLYDKLYRVPDYSQLSIKDYLVSLIDEIITNFPNSQMVNLEKYIQDFVLDEKRLQPLGIIINELLTNIMKYAFIGKDRGQITVSASNSEGHATITVQDDGIGIPESISVDNSSGFGLQLVNALAQQLDGTIRIERGAGTKIALEFTM